MSDKGSASFAYLDEPPALRTRGVRAAARRVGRPTADERPGAPESDSGQAHPEAPLEKANRVAPNHRREHLGVREPTRIVRPANPRTRCRRPP